MLGLVPSFFKSVPDNTLNLEWELFKKVQMEKGAIPNKYRELIGLGISAVSKCQYCTLFHTEAARLFGATDAAVQRFLERVSTQRPALVWIDDAHAKLGRGARCRPILPRAGEQRHLVAMRRGVGVDDLADVLADARARAQGRTIVDEDPHGVSRYDSLCCFVHGKREGDHVVAEVR